MPKLKNVIDVLKLLDKSNCKKCGKPTCLAFAAAVINGQKKLGECPKLDEATLAEFGEQVQTKESYEQKAMEVIGNMQKQIVDIDLEEAAKRLGAEFSDGGLVLHCLGRKFVVDAEGKIITDIHVNPWIAGPVLDYILYGAGAVPSGTWVPFRELEDANAVYPLFKQRCENPCKKLADTNPDFFDDLVRLFNGKQVQKHYKSDTSLVLHPLPRLPMLICYWKPDGDLPSDLNIFFDSTAEKNLSIGFIYTLASGMVTMFEKIARKHGHELK